MRFCAAIKSPSNPHLWLLALVVGRGLLHCTGMEKLEDLPPDLLRHAFAVADKDKQLELHSGASGAWPGESVVLFSSWAL